MADRGVVVAATCGRFFRIFKHDVGGQRKKMHFVMKMENPRISYLHYKMLNADR
jgi:hypothetical protein